jgi:hypothetical protein
MSAERREQILKAREENQRTAQKVELGTAYSETMKVWFVDRQQHEVAVHAVSGGQFRAACRKAGITPTPEALKDKAKLLDSMDFLAALAETATSPEIVSQLLGIDEEAKVALKAMELIKIPKVSEPSSPAPSTQPP